MTAATEWYNSESRGETPLEFINTSLADFPTEDFKYADADFVYPRTSWMVRYIIDTAPLTNRFKRVLVDVKVQDLRPEICSCLPGWHLDGSMKELEVHHLYVFNGPQTEFIDEPLHLPGKYPDIVPMIPQSARIKPTREGFITTFTSRDFHRGVYATKPTLRLLVRLTETNVIQPRNKAQAPSQGAIR